MATPVGTQKMAIPAYFRPDSTDDTDGIPYWTKLQDGRVSIAVMNPFNDALMESNPDTGDPQQNQAYADKVNETKAADVRVFGYVTTDRGRVSEDEVTTRITKYYELYNVDGVFLDETPSGDCQDEVPANPGTTNDVYFQNIYNHTKAKGGQVILNPGTQTDECYADSADVIVNFEGTYDNYAKKDDTGAYEYDKNEPAWVHNYPPSLFWHLVHTTPDEAAMRDAVRLGKQRGARYMYVTPDVMDNPWNTLPPEPYWSEELTALFSSKIRVQPDRLAFRLRQSIPSVTKTVTLTTTVADPVTVTIEDATVYTGPTDFGGGSGEFSNPSGQRTITPNGVSFPVTFTGTSGFMAGSVSGSIRVRWDSGQEIIELLGALSGPEVFS